VVGAHLIAGLGVQENPAQLYDLGGIFGHVNSMLIARRGNVNDDVSVEIALLVLARRRHLGRGLKVRVGRGGGGGGKVSWRRKEVEDSNEQVRSNDGGNTGLARKKDDERTNEPQTFKPVETQQQLP
jgi:hypothetical protein